MFLEIWRSLIVSTIHSSPCFLELLGGWLISISPRFTALYDLLLNEIYSICTNLGRNWKMDLWWWNDKEAFWLGCFINSGLERAVILLHVCCEGFHLELCPPCIPKVVPFDELFLGLLLFWIHRLFLYDFLHKFGMRMHSPICSNFICSSL